MFPPNFDNKFNKHFDELIRKLIKIGNKRVMKCNFLIAVETFVGSNNIVMKILQNSWIV